MKFFNYRQWPVKYRILAIVAVFILFLFLFSTKSYADEPKTVGELTKEAFIDGLTGTVSFIAAAEQAVFGNFYTGAALATLGAHEFVKAYEEGREAWNLYHNMDQDNDRNCDPTETNFDRTSP